MSAMMGTYSMKLPWARIARRRFSLPPSLNGALLLRRSRMTSSASAA